MSEFRENLIDRMIRVYGFEHKIVVDFAALCEKYPPLYGYDRALSVLVGFHEEYPVIEEDE